MITLHASTLTAQISLRGAGLNGLWCKGQRHSLVLGAPDPEVTANALPYAGSVVGPIANRISNGEVIIDGALWRMSRNEGTTCLHSGPDGLHGQRWSVTDQSPHHVTLVCILPHGACGLPGHRQFQATYRLTDAGTLRLELSARTDRTTLVNLTHHPYWNLDGAPTIGSHSLRVDADTYLPVDGRTCPTGQIASVTGTPYDFTRPRRVPTDVTLDANLCLTTAPRNALQDVARLTAADGPSLTIATTEPGLQVYNGTGFAPSSAALHDGRVLAPGAGIALEPQRWPDAPANPHFPGIILHADAPYRQVTEYKISL